MSDNDLCYDYMLLFQMLLDYIHCVCYSSIYSIVDAQQCGWIMDGRQSGYQAAHERTFC